MFTFPYPHPAHRLSSVFAEFDRLLQSATRDSGTVPVSVWASDEALAVTVEVPGVAKESLAITATADSLSVSGNRPHQESAPEVTWLGQERSTGTFSRTISLPWKIDPDQVEARLVDGILTIALRRAEADKPRKIAVAA
jgi:HSP20 family protein